MSCRPGRMRPQHPTPRRVREGLGDLFRWDTRSAPLAADLTVTGVVAASGDAQPGDLFVAVPGLKVHGARYAAQAVAAGAVAVLTDEAGLPAARATGVPVLLPATPAGEDDDPLGVRLRTAAGRVAAWVYGDPSRRLTTVGITGTNGKTTTAYFVDAALRAAHPLTAVLGTVELRIGDEAIESPRTTVEAPVMQGICALALERGAAALTTEVSSHGLALRRLAGMRFDVVGFTNLQRDHLDFHGDMAHYFAAKAQLFTDPAFFAGTPAPRGVVVVD
ncbi:MAG: Mur ligase family protein, partial [Micrococcales bacterium]|nr:Mur ligase family protein [Micrococcales bacterium]